MTVTDEELVQGMMDGDQASFEALVHRYHAPLSGFLQRQLKDPGRAEDVVQETFLKLLRQLKDRRSPDNVQAWLYRVAMNQCRDYWKSSGYQTDRNRFGEPPERKDERPSVVEMAERSETRREIRQTLEELPQVQREVVLLRFYQDLKLQDIADALQLPLGSVKTHLYKALRRLKTKLGKEQEAPKRAEGGEADGIAER